MKFKVYPYKQGSKSAKQLAVILEGKVLKLDNSKYKPRAGDYVINWGASNIKRFEPATTLNADVTAAQCKLASFNAFNEAGVSIPAFWTDMDAVPADAFPVVCRTKLRGHSGDGIVLAEKAEELVPAKLYTKYVKKQDEYRIHVMGETVFFMQRKARKLDVAEPNWKIRNLAGGFVFVEADEGVPAAITNQAVKAIESLGLTFGGVDLVWNEKEQKAYVLEVNTACGLEERTANKYREAFHNFVEV